MCALLQCLDQKRWLLAPVLRFDSFTLFPALLDELIFSQLWYRLNFHIDYGFFVLGSGSTLISRDTRPGCRQNYAMLCAADEI
jgi:hypothetical protein